MSKLPPAKKKGMVQEHLDGSIHLVYREREQLCSHPTPSLSLAKVQSRLPGEATTGSWVTVSIGLF